MASTFNIRGTKSPSFQIGRDGPTIFQDSNPPVNSSGNDGDIYIQVSGGTSSLYLKRSGTWDTIAAPSGTIGGIPPADGTFIVGDGTNFVPESGAIARDSLGLGAADSVTHNNLTVTDIFRGGSANATLFTDIGGNSLTLGGSSSTVVISGDLEVLGNTTVVNSSELTVTDKNITVNQGGDLVTSEGAGLNIEASASIVGYARVSETDNSLFELKAPTGSTLTLDINTLSTLTMNGSLTVNGNGVIDQDLSQGADVRFDSMQLGAPTGGFKGSGSLNVESLFINDQEVLPSNQFDELSELNDVSLSSKQNEQYLQYDGSNWVNTFINSPQQVLYVAQNGQDAMGRGSLDRPFATVQAAHDAASTNTVIKIFPGTYVENLTVSKSEISFEGVAVTNVSLVEIQGKHEIALGTSRTRFKNVLLNHGVPGEATLTIDDTNGRNSFENVEISHAGGTSETVVEFTGTNQYWHDFENCNINGEFFAGGSTGIDPRILIRNSDSPNLIFKQSTSGWVTLLMNCVRIGSIEHDAGIIALESVKLFTTGLSTAIQSNATSSPFNFISVRNSSFRQPDGSFKNINKVGTCEFIVDNCLRDAVGDTLNGTRADFGTRGEDILGDHVPASYSVANPSLKQHLIGIDNELGILNSTVNLIDITSPQDDQLLQFNGSDFVNVDRIGPTNIHYVSTNGQDQPNRGSFHQPFASIQYAIDNTSGVRVIKVSPGGYTEDVTINDSTITNLLIEGWGVDDSHPVKVNGSLNISNNLTRVRLKNMRFQGQVAGTPTVEIVGTQGRHYFESCTFDHVNGPTETVLNVIGTFQNWVVSDESTFSGNISLGADPAAGSFVSISGGSLSAATITQDDPNWALVISRVGQVQKIIHNSGSLFVDRVGAFEPATGPGIESTATVSSATNLVSLTYTSLIKSDLSLATINKTGACPFYLSHVNRDVNNDVLSGTRIAYGDFVNDISANRTPSNYTASSLSLLDHLDGIDTELDNLQSFDSTFSFSSLSAGDVLYYNGTNIVNTPPGNTSGVQAWDQQLDEISTVSPIDGTIIVGNGTSFVGESGSTARTSLGLGTGDNVEFTDVTSTGTITQNNGTGHEAINYVLKNTTTDNTQTELFLDGVSSRLVLNDNTTWLYEVTVIGRRTDANDQHTGYKVIGIIDRQTGSGSVALVGDQEVSFSRNLVPWTVTVDADSSNGSLRVQVTGENGKTVKWTAFVKVVETGN